MLQVDFPTAIGAVLDRDDGGSMMEIDGDKNKQGGPTYYIDTNALRVPRENMEAISPLKNGMSMVLRFLFSLISISEFRHNTNVIICYCLAAKIILD